MKNSNTLRLVFLSVVVFGAMLTGISCSDDDKLGDRPYFYSGTITDSVSGVAIELASIGTDTIGAGPYFSDTVGSYRGLTYSSPITVYVRKAGYQTQSRTLHLDADLTGVDFKLVQ